MPDTLFSLHIMEEMLTVQFPQAFKFVRSGLNLGVAEELQRKNQVKLVFQQDVCDAVTSTKVLMFFIVEKKIFE